MLGKRIQEHICLIPTQVQVHHPSIARIISGARLEVSTSLTAVCRARSRRTDSLFPSAQNLLMTRRSRLYRTLRLQSLQDAHR
jgi:hypothetical protein